MDPGGRVGEGGGRGVVKAGRERERQRERETEREREREMVEGGYVQYMSSITSAFDIKLTVVQHILHEQ